MYSFSSKLIKSRLLHASAALAIAFLLPSCGGGGGGSDNLAEQPAPQTLHGLTLSLYGGFDLIFLRDSGNVLNGGLETGTVIVTSYAETSPDGAAEEVETLDPVTVTPSDQIFLTTYTYDRTGSDSGLIVITGSAADGGDPAADYMAPDAVDFVRNYRIVFATDGAFITSLVLEDWGEATPAPGINWLGAQLKLNSGGDVPVGYSLDLSLGQPLPYLFPTISLENVQFDIIPDNPGTDYYIHTLTSSAGATFENSALSIDSGVGLANLLGSGSPSDSIQYDYQSDFTTIDTATMEIINTTGVSANFPELTKFYTLTFGDYQSGTYVDNNGQTGEFRFPDFATP